MRDGGCSMRGTKAEFVGVDVRATVVGEKAGGSEEDTEEADDGEKD